MKMRNNKKKSSIRFQLLASFLLLIFALSFVISSSSLIINKQAVKKQIQNAFSLTLDYVSSGISSKLKDIGNISDYIFTNNVIKDAISDTDNDLIIKRQKRQIAEDELISYTLPEFYENINRITITNSNEIIFQSLFNYTDYKNDGLQALYEEWTQQARNAKGQAVWSGIITRKLNPYQKNSLEIKEIILYRIIKNEKYTADIGTMYISVNDRLFSSQIQNYYSNYPDFENCSIYVSDRNGNLINSESCPVSKTEIMNYISLDTNVSEKGIFSPEHDCSIFVKKIVDGWFLIGLLPETVYLVNDQYFKKMTFIIFSLSIFACCLIWLYISSGIFRPLQNISKAMNRIADGEYTLRITDMPQNEVGELGNNLNEMLGKLEKLNQENRAKEIEMLDAMYREKQAQINPHFIYNTLNSIRYMAVMTGAENIKQALDALWAIEKYHTNNSREVFTTIDEEISIVKKYIYLQKLAYGSQFEVKWDIEKDISIYYCLKFFLQPLVENAIKHGALPKEGLCTIRISIYQEDEMLVFNIYDDGAGMDEETINHLKQKKLKSGEHIGVLNIIERLQYAYNDRYQFDISSKKGRFTNIMVKMPFKLHK